jgi:glucose-1-phosphate thymidylyltransferase
MAVRTAVVLCAGQGTRLRPLTLSRPKALVRIANRTIVERIARSLVEAGIRRIVLVLAPGDRQTEPHVAQHLPSGVTVEAVIQPQPGGLADAVVAARQAVAHEPFLLHLGDALVLPGVAGFVQAATDGGDGAAVLLQEVSDPEHFGVAVLAGEKVVQLVEKPAPPAPSHLALVGVYLLPPAIFAAIERTSPSPRGELEITDAIQQLINMGVEVRGLVHRGTWFDIGRFETMLAANRFCLEQEASCAAAELPGAAVEGRVTVGEGCTADNCRLIGPVAVGAHCRLRDAVLGPYVSLGDGCLIQSSRLADCIVGDGCQIIGMSGGLYASVLGDHVYVESKQPPGCGSLIAGDCTRLQLGTRAVP